mgnify:CR=1 FL=1
MVSRRRDLRSDREVVLAALAQSGSAFRHASAELRGDRAAVAAEGDEYDHPRSLAEGLAKRRAPQAEVAAVWAAAARHWWPGWLHCD